MSRKPLLEGYILSTGKELNITLNEAPMLKHASNRVKIKSPVSVFNYVCRVG